MDFSELGCSIKRRWPGSASHRILGVLESKSFSLKKVWRSIGLNKIEQVS